MIGCTTQAADNTVTKVESFSVQELDDEKYIKEQEKKGEAKLTKNYKLLNNNFSVINDDKFTGCTDLENNAVGSYVIKNRIDKQTVDKVKYSYVIYRKGKGNKCEKIRTVQSSQAYKSIQFNNALYLEVEPKRNNDANKRRLYKFDGKDLTLIKKDMRAVNNMVVVGDYLFISNGYRFDMLDKNDKLTNVKKKVKDTVWTISNKEDGIYIIFRNKDNGSLSVNEYSLTEDVIPKRIEDLTLESSRKLAFNDAAYANTISQEITKSTEDYVIFGDNMICKSDYTSCKHVEIEGETIQNVVGDFVIYNSDRTYLSNYELNTKEPLASLIIKYASLTINEKENDRKDLLFKIYTDNGKDHEYFQYEIDRKY